MATITKPNTFSAGTVIIASEHNSNFDTIYSDYNGNITNANIAAGAAIADTKLGQITTASKVSGAALTSLTSIPSAAGIIPPANVVTDISVRVNRTAVQSIANATNTAINFTAERWDTDTMHDTVTNNTRLTATTAGKYLIFGHVEWTSNATGTRRVRILLNGTTVIGESQTIGNSTGNLTQSVSTHYNLAATDYVELAVLQVSGGALDCLNTANSTPEFGMVKLP